MKYKYRISQRYIMIDESRKGGLTKNSIQTNSPIDQSLIHLNKT
jgi:hypothetical protein